LIFIYFIYFLLILKRHGKAWQLAWDYLFNGAFIFFKRGFVAGYLFLIWMFVAMVFTRLNIDLIFLLIFWRE